MTAHLTFGNTLGMIPANMDGGESESSYLPTQNADGGTASGTFSENTDGGNA